MLILNNTTDKLQLTTDAAVTVDVHASFVDHTKSTDNVESDRQNTAISTATTTDIVAAPASSGVTRTVPTIIITNKHASTSVGVTVLYDQNGTDFVIHPTVTLRAGEQLIWKDDIGWFVKSVAAAQLRTVKLSADQSNSTTTPTEVAGLSLLTGLGTFFFRYLVLYQAAATTTGVRLSVNHTGTVTAFVANLHFATAETTATATQTAAADQDVVTATAGLYESFAARAKSTAGWGTTTAVDTANADMLAVIEGLMVVTADGDIELWHGSEVAAASTVKAGSSLLLTRTGD